MCLRQWRDCRLQKLIYQIDDRRQAQGALFDGQITGHLDHVDAMFECQQQQMRISELPDSDFGKSRTAISVIPGQFGHG